MKKTILILILSIIMFNNEAQDIVYDSDGDKQEFTFEEIDIVFHQSNVTFPDKPGQKQSAALVAALPVAVDIGINLFTKWLEKEVEKYTAEYSKTQSYLEAGTQVFPHFTFTRTIQLEDKDSTEIAFEAVFKIEPVTALKAVVICIDSVTLNYAAAKSKKSNSSLDYVFEIKPTFAVNDEKKVRSKQVQEIAPIVVSSVSYGENSYANKQHRSEIIFLPEGSFLTEVTIKIIETNPHKVRAENILSLWNENKDSVTTIIKEYLPKADDEEEDEENGDDDENGGKATDPNGDASNQDTGKKPD